MKKKLREDIKSLAKKITNEEKNFNTQSIKSLTKELYEKLVVLDYLEMQIGEHSEVLEESLDSKSFREENWFSEPIPVPQPEDREDIVEPVMEKIKDIVAQMPEESDEMDEKLEQIFSNDQYMNFYAAEEEDNLHEEQEMTEMNFEFDEREEQGNDVDSEKRDDEDDLQEAQEMAEINFDLLEHEPQVNDIDSEERVEEDDLQEVQEMAEINFDFDEHEPQVIHQDSQAYDEQVESVPHPVHNTSEITENSKNTEGIVDKEEHESQQVMEEPEKQVQATSPRNELEEFASNYQQMPVFERKSIPSTGETIVSKPQEEVSSEPKKIGYSDLSVKRIRSLNDSVNKGLNIALNDRLIFIKQLFEGKSEDYTRVLSQINTMTSYEEAASFIKHQVKPDYNNWSNKEDYIDRFMIIVEKRFD